MSYNGLFITFEGGEGSGKTTLITHLAKNLNKQYSKVCVTREPGGTHLGEAIRKILLDTEHAVSPLAELSLFLAARAQHIEEMILPALHKGFIVLCDRFQDSTIAYQGYARGLDVQQVLAYSSFVSQNVQPDKTFYLDLDPRVGFIRTQRQLDRIESEAIDFHQTIRKAYLTLSEENKERIQIIDASQSPTQLLEEVTVCLQTFLPSITL